ncbi:hypothetical protein PATSB16_19710 [Pandoraea thiooxydans]|nr:hypothetical protein PATSB16_19710 [Pandoraea thiooxydans]
MRIFPVDDNLFDPHKALSRCCWPDKPRGAATLTHASAIRRGN